MQEQIRKIIVPPQFSLWEGHHQGRSPKSNSHWEKFHCKFHKILHIKAYCSVKWKPYPQLECKNKIKNPLFSTSIWLINRKLKKKSKWIKSNVHESSTSTPQSRNTAFPKWTIDIIHCSFQRLLLIKKKITYNQHISAKIEISKQVSLLNNS